MYSLLRRALFTLEPETAHALTLSSLRLADKLHLLAKPNNDSSSAISLMGLRFPNRIGLAAGFDKNACCIDPLGSLGFGFIEVGTVTPLPQSGQSRPRLFRLPPSAALINRMGFPNEGSIACAKRLSQRTYGGVCGVNIGKNATTPIPRAIDDYLACFRTIAPYANYVAINVSSPNTPDLRRLQQVEYLRPILESLVHEKQALTATLGRPVPLLLKVSPDLSAEELTSVAELLLDVGIDGVIATNTTTTRPFSFGAAGHIRANYSEEGGLSGEPLRPLALDCIRILRSALGPTFPIVGVGGIASAADALAMLKAGASLIQIYTGLIYRGPALINDIRRSIDARQ